MPRSLAEALAGSLCLLLLGGLQLGTAASVGAGVLAFEASAQLRSGPIFTTGRRSVALRVDNLPFAAQVPTDGKRFLQEGPDPDQICYEGCFVAPDLDNDPLPIYLLAGSQTGDADMTLEDCYLAAKPNGLEFFGVVDRQYCFGGASFRNVLRNWNASDACPLDCIPGNKGYPGPCGAANQGVFFSLGECSNYEPPVAPSVPEPPASPAFEAPTPPSAPVSSAVCYQGCAPLSDPAFIALDGAVSLDECRNAAELNGLALFGIRYNDDGSFANCAGSFDQPSYVDNSTCSTACPASQLLPLTCGGADAEGNPYLSVYVLGPCALPPPTLPDAPNGPPPPSPSTPSGPKQYRCKDRNSLWGKALASSKLHNQPSHSAASDACKALCDAEPDCAGFSYKTTGWCYRVSEVYAWTGTKYKSSYRACRVTGA